jgi:hypothetical protein
MGVDWDPAIDFEPVERPTRGTTDRWWVFKPSPDPGVWNVRRAFKKLLVDAGYIRESFMDSHCIQFLDETHTPADLPVLLERAKVIVSLDEQPRIASCRECGGSGSYKGGGRSKTCLLCRGTGLAHG